MSALNSRTVRLAPRRCTLNAALNAPAPAAAPGGFADEKPASPAADGEMQWTQLGLDPVQHAARAGSQEIDEMRNSGQAGGCDSLMNSHGAAYERDSSMSHCCSMCCMLVLPGPERRAQRSALRAREPAARPSLCCHAPERLALGLVSLSAPDPEPPWPLPSALLPAPAPRRAGGRGCNRPSVPSGLWPLASGALAACCVVALALNPKFGTWQDQPALTQAAAGHPHLCECMASARASKQL